jgi:hypothetical protein
MLYLDPYPNLFLSFSAPELDLDLDPNKHENQDPDQDLVWIHNTAKKYGLANTILTILRFATKVKIYFSIFRYCECIRSNYLDQDII